MQRQAPGPRRHVPVEPQPGGVGEDHLAAVGDQPAQVERPRALAGQGQRQRSPRFGRKAEGPREVVAAARRDDPQPRAGRRVGLPRDEPRDDRLQRAVAPRRNDPRHAVARRLPGRGEAVLGTGCLADDDLPGAGENGGRKGRPHGAPPGGRAGVAVEDDDRPGRAHAGPARSASSRAAVRRSRSSRPAAKRTSVSRIEAGSSRASSSTSSTVPPVRQRSS